MPVTILLLALTAIAVGTDIRRHKIYNWTTYPGILAAFALNACGDLLLRLDYVSESRLESLGWISLWQSAGGFLLCGLLMLACFVFFRIGGGDVKLMAMLGAFLGPYQGLESLLWTFILGGCAGAILLIWRVGAWRLIARVFRQIVWSLRIFGWSPLSDEERVELQSPLFLAPSALAAVIVVKCGAASWLM
jgi:prepilin peptidase CpaA